MHVLLQRVPHAREPAGRVDEVPDAHQAPPSWAWRSTVARAILNYDAGAGEADGGGSDKLLVRPEPGRSLTEDEDGRGAYSPWMVRWVAGTPCRY